MTKIIKDLGRIQITVARTQDDMQQEIKTMRHNLKKRLNELDPEDDDDDDDEEEERMARAYWDQFESDEQYC